MGFKLVSRGERYENDVRKSVFDVNNQIELDYVVDYELDCATPPTSIAKNYEVKKEVKITLEIPKSDYRNPNVQNILKWGNLPVQSDDYYRDLAINTKMGGENYRTLLFSHARITLKTIHKAEYDFVTMEIYAKQKEDKYVGVVIGTDLESTYEKAKERLKNPPTMNWIAPVTVEKAPDVSEETYNGEYWIDTSLCVCTAVRVLSTSGINLRADKTTDSAVIVTIPYNEELKVIKAVNDYHTDWWYNVDYQGNAGWIAQTDPDTREKLLLPLNYSEKIVMINPNGVLFIFDSPYGNRYDDLHDLGEWNGQYGLPYGSIVTLYQPYTREGDWERISDWRPGNIQDIQTDETLNFDTAMAKMDNYLDGGILPEDAVEWFANNGEQTSLGQFQSEEGGADYNRYDTEILAFTNYLNAKYGEKVDANVIKAMTYVETKVGYDTGEERGNFSANGGVDIMQCLDDRNFAVHRLAAMGGVFNPIEGRAYIPEDGYGLFKNLYADGTYNKAAATVEMSIVGGVLWFLVKDSDPHTYNMGNPGYLDDLTEAIKLMGMGGYDETSKSIIY